MRNLIATILIGLVGMFVTLLAIGPPAKRATAQTAPATAAPASVTPAVTLVAGRYQATSVNTRDILVCDTATGTCWIYQPYNPASATPARWVSVGTPVAAVKGK